VGSIQLKVYERHIACLLMAVLASLGFVGMDFSKSEMVDAKQRIEVVVVGAVKKTSVVVLQGASFGDVCEQAILSEDADVSNIDMTKKVTQNEVVVIPVRGKQTFFVQGAVVEPRVVFLDGDVSARVILSKVEVTDEADIKSFNRRRVFKNGSVIEIKRKKKVKSS
jgi:hypothetical protein